MVADVTKSMGEKENIVDIRLSTLEVSLKEVMRSIMFLKERLVYVMQDSSNQEKCEEPSCTGILGKITDIQSIADNITSELVYIREKLVI